MRFHYQILCGLIGFLVLLVVLCIAGIPGSDFQTVISIFSIGILAPFLVLGILFFYPIAQTVHIDAKGIRIRFFRKTLRAVTWEQIMDVQACNYNRGPGYLFTIRDDGTLNLSKNENELRLERRKKLKSAIMRYCTDDIRKTLSKLPPKV